MKADTQAREVVRMAAMIESALLDGDSEQAERLTIRFYELQAKPWEPMTEEDEANERDWGYGLEHDENEKPAVCSGCGYPDDECRCEGDISDLLRDRTDECFR